MPLSPRLEQLRQRLIDTARRQNVMHYGPAADMLGITADRLDHCPELAQALDEVSTFEHEHGRPLLSVVVVRQEDSRPGAGFFKMATRNGIQTAGQDDDDFLVAELRRVHAYWQAHQA